MSSHSSPSRILALETSTDRCSVALLHGAELRVRETAPGEAHSEHVLGLVDAVLADAGCRLAALDAVAFGCGPGAFTGLRVACGVAQGLAFGADLPVVPVASPAALALEAWTASGWPARPIAVLMDARMQELYAALVAFEGDAGAPRLAALQGPVLLGAGDGVHWLKQAGWDEGVAAGDGLRSLGALAAETAWPQLQPGAAAVARLAVDRLRAGEGIAPEAAAPLYVRDKVAYTTAERLARAAHGLDTGNPSAGGARP